MYALCTLGILFGFCNIIDNVMLSHGFSICAKPAKPILACMNFPKTLMSEHNLRKVTSKLTSDLTALPATAHFYPHLAGVNFKPCL